MVVFPVQGYIACAVMSTDGTKRQNSSGLVGVVVVVVVEALKSANSLSSASALRLPLPCHLEEARLFL